MPIFLPFFLRKKGIVSVEIRWLRNAGLPPAAATLPLWPLLSSPLPSSISHPASIQKWDRRWDGGGGDGGPLLRLLPFSGEEEEEEEEEEGQLMLSLILTIHYVEKWAKFFEGRKEGRPTRRAIQSKKGGAGGGVGWWRIREPLPKELPERKTRVAFGISLPQKRSRVEERQLINLPGCFLNTWIEQERKKKKKQSWHFKKWFFKNQQFFLLCW